jgi:hypothetical protein
MRTGISMLRTLKASTRICLKGVGPRVLAYTASLHSGSPHSPWESIQHAGSPCAKAPGQDSHRVSPFGHSRGWKPIAHRSPASTFLRPFAPLALPRFLATMDALTPARLALRHTSHEHQPCSGQVSLLHTARPSMHSVTKHLTRPAIALCCSPSVTGFPFTALMGSPWRLSGLDFALNPQARRYVRPNRVRHPTDCMFTSGCSPPRLATTQLPLITGSEHLPEEDLHLSDRACSQAHGLPACGRSPR